jgi:predicted transposase YdaD
MTRTPHDAFFKAAFENTEHVGGLFRCVLPATCVDAMDWATLSLEAGSFVDAALGKQHSDLLFSIDILGARAYLYLLLEHQSRNDRVMPRRSLRYLDRIWDRHCKEYPGQPLPIVIPIVISHAPEGWTAPRDMHALFEPHPSSVPELAPFVPSFSIIVEDLAHLGNEQLKDRALTAFARLALWVLRDARDAERLFHNLGEWASAFREALQAPYGTQAVELLLRYIALVTGNVNLERFRAKIIEHVPEAEETVVTIAEEQQAIGRQQGLQQGRVQLLEKQLTLKFGQLPADTRGRLEAADAEQLDRFAERILTAASLDEVFADPTE